MKFKLGQTAKLKSNKNVLYVVREIDEENHNYGVERITGGKKHRIRYVPMDIFDELDFVYAPVNEELSKCSNNETEQYIELNKEEELVVHTNNGCYISGSSVKTPYNGKFICDEKFVYELETILRKLPVYSIYCGTIYMRNFTEFCIGNVEHLIKDLEDKKKLYELYLKTFEQFWKENKTKNIIEQFIQFKRFKKFLIAHF